MSIEIQVSLEVGVYRFSQHMNIALSDFIPSQQCTVSNVCPHISCHDKYSLHDLGSPI